MKNLDTLVFVKLRTILFILVFIVVLFLTGNILFTARAQALSLTQVCLSEPLSVGCLSCKLGDDYSDVDTLCGTCEMAYSKFADENIGLDDIPDFCKEPVNNYGKEVEVVPSVTDYVTMIGFIVFGIMLVVAGIIWIIIKNKSNKAPKIIGIIIGGGLIGVGIYFGVTLGILINQQTFMSYDSLSCISAENSISCNDCESSGIRNRSTYCKSCEEWYQEFYKGNVEDIPSYCKNPEDGGDEIGVTPELIEVPVVIE